MKRKHIALLFILFFIGTLVYNFIMYDYEGSIFLDKNLPFIIGICAGFCGLLLSIIVFRFQQIKEKIDKN